MPCEIQAGVHATILNSINEGVFAAGRDWRITSFNQEAEKITGISRERAIGRPRRETFRASICEGDCALRQTIESGMPVVRKPACRRNKA